MLAVFKHAISDRYVIDTEIGRGGMAVVYAARDLRLGRGVALKVLAPSLASRSGVKAFHREIAHTAQLEHPNVLPLLDAGEAAGLCYYVMRWVRGGSLRRALARPPGLSAPDGVSIVQQTAAALQYAHDHEVLHCDVKPENILLDGDHVYLADFGLSRAVRAHAFAWDSGADIDSGGGTARYVSPEQALGESGLDRRTDVYSLACVAYELLAGQPPFCGRNDRDVVARRFSQPDVDFGPVPAHVPPAARRALARALALDPAERPSTAREFADRLARGIPANGARGRGLETAWWRPRLRRMVRRLRRAG
jgi:eukaryotic-like serine/threonine-protein kinase